MDLTLNSLTQIAYIKDWDQTDWDARKGEIPWNYTIEFDPSLDQSVIASLNTGRELFYDRRTIYVQQWIGSSMVVYQETIFVQQLLPLPTEPVA